MKPKYLTIAASLITITALCLGEPSKAFARMCSQINYKTFNLRVDRSDSLSDLIFSWRVKPPFHYDVFNVRVRESGGLGEPQRELPGGASGRYTERNVAVGTTVNFKVQGCDKRTFGSKCTGWFELQCTNAR
jgi:hypothetical protein